MIFAILLAVQANEPPPPPRIVFTPVARQVIGAGSDECETWNIRGRGGSSGRVGDMEWLRGFISGANFERIEHGRATANLQSNTYELVVRRMDEFCERNPSRRVVEGARMLWREIVQVEQPARR